MYRNTREEEVLLIKSLLAEEKVLCPQCGHAHLEHFHKKAKKRNTDYICPACNERYQVIKMMDALN